MFSAHLLGRCDNSAINFIQNVKQLFVSLLADLESVIRFVYSQLLLDRIFPVFTCADCSVKHVNYLQKAFRSNFSIIHIQRFRLYSNKSFTSLHFTSTCFSCGDQVLQGFKKFSATLFYHWQAQTCRSENFHKRDSERTDLIIQQRFIMKFSEVSKQGQ